MNTQPYSRDGFLLIPAEITDRRTIKLLLPDVKWAGRRNAWYLPDTVKNRAAVTGVFRQIVAAPSVIAGPAAPPHTHGGYTDGFPFKTRPRAHQKTALEVCGGREAFGYTMDPGTGKSKTAIDDMQILAQRQGLRSVAVFCPKSVIYSWLTQFRVHGSWENTWSIAWWDPDRSRPVVTEYEAENPTLRWLVMSVDSLRYPRAYREAERFLEDGPSAIILDESTRAKNIQSQRTARLLKLAPLTRYRRILTGTLIANTLLDVFSQLTFLDDQIFRGWSMCSFKEHFCILGGYQGKEILGFCNEDELAAVLARHTYRVTLAECTDLPERVYEERRFTLGPAARAVYKEVCEQVRVELAEGRLTATQAITKLTKLRQITGGWVLNDAGEPVELGTEKREVLLEVLDEFQGMRALVWCVFKHEVVGIAEAVRASGRTVATFHGGLSSTARAAVLDGFATGAYDVLVLQVDTGGVGLTLNEATLSVFYSNAHLPETRKQAEGRNYRDGQTRRTVVVDLAATGTVDVSILQTIRGKLDLAAALLDSAAGGQVLQPVDKWEE